MYLLACHWVPQLQRHFRGGKSSGFLCFSLASPSKILQGRVYPRNSDLTPDALSPEDPLWPGKSAQQAWGELFCPLLSQDPWPGFLFLPTGQSSGRAGGRKDARRVWSLFINRKWLLPVHPRERCCPAGLGSQTPARKVPRMPLLPSLQGPRGYPGATKERPKVPELRFCAAEARVSTLGADTCFITKDAQP